MTILSSYDDGENLPTPGDDLTDEHHEVLAAIRAIADPATRRAVLILFVLTVLKGRIGR